MTCMKLIIKNTNFNFNFTIKNIALVLNSQERSLIYNYENKIKIEKFIFYLFFSK